MYEAIIVFIALILTGVSAIPLRKGLFHLIRYFSMSMMIAIPAIFLPMAIDDSKMDANQIVIVSTVRMILFCSSALLFYGMMRNLLGGVKEARFLINGIREVTSHRSAYYCLQVVKLEDENSQPFEQEKISEFECDLDDYLKFEKLLQENDLIEATISYYSYGKLLHSIKDIKLTPKQNDNSKIDF